MSPWIYALLSTLTVSVLPVLFLSLVPLLKSRGSVTVSGRWLNWFMGFSAGALLGDAFLHLISEGHSHETHTAGHGHSHSHEHEHGHKEFAILSGILVFFGIELFSMDSCHSHSHSHKKSDDPDHHKDHKINGFLSLLADSIHNFTDGLTIAAAWTSNFSAGISTTIAIFVHEIPHELGDYAVLSRAGYSHNQILKCQLFTAMAAFAGTFLGLFLQTSPSFAVLSKAILPFSAGGFIYLALASIIPEILKSKTSSSACKRELFLQFATFIMGILLMTILE